MKQLFLVFLMVLLAGAAYGQSPEIDIAGNWCHFARSTENAGDEVFVGGCDGQIDVIGGVANGYARVVRRNGIGLVSQTITSEDAPNIQCQLVESNDTTYTSNDWKSEIKARHRWVTFTLTCRDGHQE